LQLRRDCPVTGSAKVKNVSYTVAPSAFVRATTEPPPRSRRCRANARRAVTGAASSV